jgi:hypothetical protein
VKKLATNHPIFYTSFSDKVVASIDDRLKSWAKQQFYQFNWWMKIKSLFSSDFENKVSSSCYNKKSGLDLISIFD